MLNYCAANKSRAKCVKLVVAELQVIMLSGHAILWWLRKSFMLYSYCFQKNTLWLKDKVKTFPPVDDYIWSMEY